jgi:hypothetical protein
MANLPMGRSKEPGDVPQFLAKGSSAEQFDILFRMSPA